MNKHRLLLVSANVFAVPYPVYPLGISYIATYLQSRMDNYEIKLFDFIKDDSEAFISMLEEFKPDHIGISLRNVDDVNSTIRESFIRGYQNAVELSRLHSKAAITIGGSAYSIYPEYLYDVLKPDYAIYGEGEESYRKLLLALDNGLPLKDIEGLLYMENGKLIMNERSNFYRDLELNLDSDLIEFYWQNSGMLSIQTKRGCPFSCIFCTYPVIEGKKVRTLNPDMIVNSLVELYEKKGIDYYFFTDSVFNIHDQFNYRLAEKIIASGIKIKWGAYFSPYNMNPKLMALLRKSGLTHIEFGSDSISDTQLRNYDKKFTVKDIIEKSALCHDLGINYAHFLILGGYGETDATIDETFENCQKIEDSVFFPFIGMRIYPQTKLLEYAIRDGFVAQDDLLLEPKYYISRDFNPDTLKEKAKKTGKSWIFPDEDLSDGIIKFRKKNKKGPLWEYLIK